MNAPDPIGVARRAVERVATGHPSDDEDLVSTAAVDSMGFVEILTALGIPADWPEGKPRSIRVLAGLLAEPRVQQPASLSAVPDPAQRAGLLGWGVALGSRAMTAADLDAHYGLSAETIGPRTGLESVVWAAGQENEATLAQRACEQALRSEAGDIDLLLSTSETFLGFPSLAATLHSALLLPERCWALDVGGGCLGLLNAVATAQGLLGCGARRRALVVAADVHSRRFAGTSAPWQLASLFGDGAGALLLSRDAAPYTLGGFTFGCAGAFSAAIRIAPSAAGDLAIDFRGQQLADAAISHLARLIQDLEIRTGVSRSQVDGFAFHEPTPRAVDLLARRAAIPLEKFPLVSRTCGNLGSATCAAGLVRLLERQPAPRVIFLASLGPGLLWGAGCLLKLA